MSKVGGVGPTRSPHLRKQKRQSPKLRDCAVSWEGRCHDLSAAFKLTSFSFTEHPASGPSWEFPKNQKGIHPVWLLSGGHSSSNFSW